MPKNERKREEPTSMTYDALQMPTPSSLNIKDQQKRIELGKLVVARRTELGMSQTDIPAAGGPGSSNIRFIEHGRLETITIKQLHKLEKTLGWKFNSIENFVKNGTMPELSNDGVARDIENEAVKRLERVVNDLQRRVNEIESTMAAMKSALR